MLEFNFNPFPEIRTARLLLRAITPDDAPALFALRSSIDVLRYIDKPPHRTQEETLGMIRKIREGTDSNETIGWALSLHSDPALIGTISYHRIEKEHYRAEIGYMLHPGLWRQGFTSEAVEAVLDFGFQQMRLHSIEANVNPHNKASTGVLKKFGFVREAYFKENYFFNGKFLDTEIYSLLAANWR